jgi:hypothetical protein
MSEPVRTENFVHVEHLLEAPVIFFDAVPTVGVRGPIVTVTLGLTVSELVSKGSSESHLVAVADLRMPITAAVQLRDALNKALLAVAPTPGAGVAN